MKKLSKDAETRILTALESVADSVNEGISPNDAIVKAASAHDIPAGHVNLMVSAYNTGRTGKQRMAAESPFDKAATFELANHSDIMGRLYPTQVKSAAQKRDETIIDDEYAQAPVFAHHKKAAQVAARKVNWQLVDTAPEPYPGEAHTPIKRAFHSTEFDKRRFEACRREVSCAKDLLSASLEKLANYFRTPGGVSFDDVCDAVEIQHGGMGKAILNQISRTVPQLSKEAKHNCSAIHPDATHEKWMALKKKKRQEKSAGILEVQPTQAPWVWVRESIKLASDVHEKQKELDSLSQHVVKSAEARLRPFSPRQGRSVLGLPLPTTNEKQSGVGSVYALSHLFGNATRGMKTQGAEQEFAVQDYLEELDDPSHAADLKRIHVRAQLENMMANDPVLSLEDPAMIAEAYNEIVQLSPSAADSPLMMRNLLRQHMSTQEGGGGIMDPRDIGANIIDNEKSLLEIQRPNRDQVTSTPGGGPGVGGKNQVSDLARKQTAEDAQSMLQRNWSPVSDAPDAVGALPEKFKSWNEDRKARKAQRKGSI